jgi:hypothetical protein
MVLLEDALDIQGRHFRIHWLNIAQFASFLNFGPFNGVTGEADPVLTSKIEVPLLTGWIHRGLTNCAKNSWRTLY